MAASVPATSGPALREGLEQEASSAVEVEEEVEDLSDSETGVVSSSRRSSLLGRDLGGWGLQQRGELAGVTTSTVHDEIQVDCEVQDIREVSLIVQREMEAFTGLFGSVPVIADLETTITNWADKKEWTP